MNKVNVVKIRPDAVIPYKKHPEDVGYDIVLLEKFKDLDEVTALYHTGIKIDLKDHNKWLGIHARSSLTKSGYMVTNSVGVIESTYRGEIFVSLTKVNQFAPEIELNKAWVQFILHDRYDVEFNEIDEKDLTSTDRGEGGFGSTD